MLQILFECIGRAENKLKKQHETTAIEIITKGEKIYLRIFRFCEYQKQNWTEKIKLVHTFLLVLLVNADTISKSLILKLFFVETFK